MKNLKYLVPNLFTTLSLVSALIAINYASKGEFILSPWLIILSMVCDFIDGYTARKLNATSQFGSMFDTMSDFVAFGVTPAFLAYRISLQFVPVWGGLTAILFVLAGCFRLIRFTINQKDPSVKKSFVGLPIPIAAGFIALVVILSLRSWNSIPNNYLFLLMVLMSAYLMISEVEYLAINIKGKLTLTTKLVFIAFLFSIVLFFRYSYWAFLFWITGYILFCLFRHLLLKAIKLFQRSK